MIHSINGFVLPLQNLQTCGNSVGKSCPDNIIGNIIYDNGVFIGENNTNEFGLQRDSSPVGNIQQRMPIDYSTYKHIDDLIAIILESPHIKEYKNSLGIEGPAMGSSGNRFNRQCIPVFNNNKNVLISALGITANSQKKEYTVCFVNAIQYQCSLGFSPIKKDLRDKVFSGLWNRGPDSFRNDLIDRLNILKPKVIINACTKGLKNTCCNGESITRGLNYSPYLFLTASDHILFWDKNTYIL